MSRHITHESAATFIARLELPAKPHQLTLGEWILGVGVKRVRSGVKLRVQRRDPEWRPFEPVLHLTIRERGDSTNIEIKVDPGAIAKILIALNLIMCVLCGALFFMVGSYRLIVVFGPSIAFMKLALPLELVAWVGILAGARWQNRRELDYLRAFAIERLKRAG